MTMQTETWRVAKRSAWASGAVLVLTSVHHAYGAYRYATPWRLHVVGIAVVAALGLMGALAWLRARPTGGSGWAATGLFALVTLAIPVGMIGAYEGLYNHLLKNILFFGGTSPALLLRLFPPPTYELPNDVLFELTGSLQVLPAVIAAQALLQFLRARKDRRVAVRPT
ncbi:hypothetical protein LZ198_19745 [Myxococcus sp. K15C18031901]|uniref:hypothetical protein n=1 Tax=Myxococcus dinghuensis TaxID=2906761 RepID=UPI0020A8173F|nr:hypothetical protein [Myxococcus dinghuensis]MCP3101112.1 hypothetical protein [Myxococcus dinghuensis]